MTVVEGIPGEIGNGLGVIEEIRVSCAPGGTVVEVGVETTRQDIEMDTARHTRR